MRRLAKAIVVLFAIGAMPSAALAAAPEHPVADAHANEDDHHHGDADDRHESPTSPCHHHDAALPTCACGPTVMALSAGLGSLVDFGRVARLHQTETRPHPELIVDELAHVPLA